jgi:hypothetical protein
VIVILSSSINDAYEQAQEKQSAQQKKKLSQLSDKLQVSLQPKGNLEGCSGIPRDCERKKRGQSPRCNPCLKI